MKSWGERPVALVVKDSDHVSGYQVTDIKAHLQAFVARCHLEIRHPREDPVRRPWQRRASARSTRSFCVKRMRTSRNGSPPDDRQNERRVRSRHDAPEIIPVELNSHLSCAAKCGHPVSVAVASIFDGFALTGSSACAKADDHRRRPAYADTLSP